MPELVKISLRKLKADMENKRMRASGISNHEVLKDWVSRDPNFILNSLEAQKKAGWWDRPKGRD